VPGGWLEDADVVVVPGGNTFELLEILRSHDLLNKLVQFIDVRGRYYGGRASALLVGADIGLCDVERGGLDDNTVGIQDTQGLGLVGDICVYPDWERAHLRGRV
jgi:peptidase E